MQTKYGFKPLGPAEGPVKTAIFSGNTARLYGAAHGSLWQQRCECHRGLSIDFATPPVVQRIISTPLPADHNIRMSSSRSCFVHANLLYLKTMSRKTPSTPKPPRPIFGRIGAVLKVLHGLIAYGRHFTAAATTLVTVPEFATAAGTFGTYSLPVILHRFQRGILRALALQRYLLARNARGRNLNFPGRSRVDLQPHHRPPAKPARPARQPRTEKPRKDPALLDDDDPAAWHMPTQAEADAWVRRRPVGRTIVSVCLDLGVVPGFCDGDFWCKVENALRWYGGRLRPIFDVRNRRRAAFQRERNRMPDTWHIDWRDLRGETVRLALGMLIGETPPESPAHGLPCIVPS